MHRHASMNRFYRLIWDQVQSCWVVVSEVCSGRGKAGRARTLACAVLSLGALSGPAFGLPTDGQVTTGHGQISQNANQLTVDQTSQNLTINWQTFNIGANEGVSFNQPNSAAIALNRVLGQNASNVLGSLKANGQVFILNPNGVLFGQGAQVSVGGLVATTLSLGDQDFNAGKYSFSGSSTAGVSNAGTLQASRGGYIALVGAKLTNTGSIQAESGNVSLAAGQQVTLQLGNGSLLGLTVDKGAVQAQIDNGGLIEADGGQILLTAKAADALTTAVVNTTGIIKAQTLDISTGSIRLMGDMQTGTVNVAGTLDASAPKSGNGGQIETSAAHVKVADGTHVSTQAQSGNTGNWLIDPADYTIAASGGDISGTTLSANLNSTSVTIQSSQGTVNTNGSGAINVNDAVSWSANNTLTLNAVGNINVNASITASGAGGAVTLQYGQGAVNAGNPATYNINNGAQINLQAGNNFSTKLGIDGATTAYTVITSLGAAGSTTGTDLQGIIGNLADNYVLGANIDASATSGWNVGAGFNPLGNNATSFYTGTFDGLGHAISGLSINQPNNPSSVGLFGISSGTIRNVGLLGGSVVGNANVGDLIGWNYAGTLNNVYATGAVSGLQAVGGLVGTSFGAISNAYATGAVSGNEVLGGLVGHSTGTISTAYATGTVTAAGSIFIPSNNGGLVGVNEGSLTTVYATGAVSGKEFTGGLVGGNDGPNSTISNAYATGAVSGSGPDAGGLVGFNAGHISNAYATGAVTGAINVGGMVGINSGGVSTNAYWDTQTTGQSSSAVGTGLTTAQLQATLPTGFDSSVWGQIGGKSYAYLLTQFGALTPQVVSGIAYDSTGAAVGAGTTVSGINNGRLLSSALTNSTVTTGANGYYYDLLAPGTLSNSNLVFKTASAATFADAVNSSLSGSNGLNLYGGTLSVVTASSGLSSVLGNLGSALGSSVNAANLLSSTGVSNLSNLKISSGSFNFNDTGSTLTVPGTLAIASSGVVSQTSAISATALTGSSTGSTMLGNASNQIGNLNGYSAANGLSLSDASALTVAATVSAGTGALSLIGSSGLTLAAGSSLSGSAITLVSGGAFNNQAGGTTLNTGSSWQIWSQDPDQDILGGLTPNFKQYNASFGSSSLLGSGNGLLYTRAPILTLGLTGTVSKTYDATTTATLAGGNYSVSGAIDGDSVNVAGSGIGNYASKNVGSNLNVTSSGLNVTGVSNGGTAVYGYQLANTSATAAIGTITPAALTLTAVTDNKIYDATTTSSKAVSVSGLKTGDTATATESFASKNVLGTGGSALNVSAGYAIADGNGGANYFVTTQSAAGTITPAALTLAAVTDSKTYDATTSSSKTVSVIGLKSGDTATVTESFASKNVMGTNGSALNVNGGYAIADGNGGANYAVTTQTAAGTITPAALTLAAVTDSKTYDATTSSSKSAIATGLKGTDTATATESFASKNVLGSNGSLLNVNGSYTVSDGNGGKNYSVSTQTAQGTVAPVTLKLTAVSDSKVYDGTVSSSKTGSAIGLLSGDTISALSETFASKNVLGTNGSTLNVNGGYTIADGNGGANYAVTAQSATGTITPAALTLAAVTDSKTYDATTSSSKTVIVTGLKSGDTATATESFASKNVLGTNGSLLNVNGGYAIADGNGGANYTVTTKSATGTITPAALTLAAVTDSKVYDATTSSSKTVIVTGLKGGDTATTTESFASKNVMGANGSALNVNAGYVIADGNSGGNYTVTTQSAQGTITPAALTLAAVTDSKTYDATTISSKTVSVTGLKGSDTATATESFASKNVLGTNGSTLNVNGGYTVNDGDGGKDYSVSTQTARGTITPATLKLTAVTDSKVYDGTVSSSKTGSASGLLSGDTISGLSETFASKNVLGTNGSTLQVSGYTLNDGNGGANYSVVAQNALGTITPAALSLAAVTDTKVYDGTTNSNKAVTVTGLKGSDSINVSEIFTSKNATARGTTSTLQVNSSYTLNDGNAGKNYTVTTKTATGTITPATLTLAAASGTKVYDGTVNSNQAVSVTGLQSGDTVTASESYLSKNVYGSNGSVLFVNGGYKVNDGNNGLNYNLCVSGIFASGTITPASLILTATTDSKTYDATTNSSKSIGAIGLQTGDSFYGTQSYVSKNVLGINGSTLQVNSGYLISDGNFGNNYTISTKAAQGTITAAALTVTANNASKIVGKANPTFSASFTGLEGSDTLSSLGTLSFSTPATVNSAVGSYAIVPSGLVSLNYKISYVNGLLTVVPTLPLSIFAPGQ